MNPDSRLPPSHDPARWTTAPLTDEEAQILDLHTLASILDGTGWTEYAAAVRATADTLRSLHVRLRVLLEAVAEHDAAVGDALEPDAALHALARDLSDDDAEEESADEG